MPLCALEMQHSCNTAATQLQHMQHSCNTCGLEQEMQHSCNTCGLELVSSSATIAVRATRPTPTTTTAVKGAARELGQWARRLRRLR